MQMPVRIRKTSTHNYASLHHAQRLLRGRKLQQTRARLFEQYSHTCASCQCVTRYLELDHITPIEYGGTDEDANLQPLCVPCHEDKTKRQRRGDVQNNQALTSE